MVYTQWLNDRGGIEADVTVTRLSEQRFLVVSGVACQNRDMDWLARNKLKDGLVVITDMTSAMAVVTVMGPKSRETLAKLTQADMSNEAFPFASSQEIDMHYAVVRASRITYVGELGWELYIPTEYAPSVYDAVCEAGEEFGIRPYGYHTMNSLRMEKMYRAWGNEFTEEISGVEAGMGRFIDSSRDFIGVEVVREREKNGGEIQLAYLAFDDDIACEVFGNESVFHDGEHIGLTTGGAYGFRVGHSLAFAYIKPELVVQGTQLQVQTSHGMRWAHIEMDAVYDPENKLLRS